MPSPHTSLTREQLRAPFTAYSDAEHAGVEVELGVVDPTSGRSMPFEGARSTATLIAALLTSAAAHDDRSTPIVEDGHLIGVKFDKGDRFTLEVGGALEYSSSVHNGAAAAVERCVRRLSTAAEVADDHGMALLSGGYLPFTPSDAIPWVPKRRVGVMRDHFHGLGLEGSRSDRSMGLSLSTQVTVDYLDESDLLEKLWCVNLVAPVAAGMFVSSPIHDGRATGNLSERLRCLRAIDPERFGVLPYAVGRPPTVDAIVDWAVRHPMIYRSSSDGGQGAAPSTPFGEAIAHGFDDGTYPTEADWRSLLDQLWPHVRVRRTLEIRVCDSPFWPEFGAVPAFWTSLLYHGPSRKAAIELIRGTGVHELDTTVDRVAAHGLGATVDGTSVRDLCRELLTYAERGMEARVHAAAEPPDADSLLDPLRRVIGTGRTFAEECLEAWRGPLEERTDAYVRKYRLHPLKAGGLGTNRED